MTLVLDVAIDKYVCMDVTVVVIVILGEKRSYGKGCHPIGARRAPTQWPEPENI